MARQRRVFAASFFGALLLPLPMHWLLASTGLDTGYGSLVLVLQLWAWMLIAGIGSSAFADQHDALVYGLAILLYATAYFALSVPAHWLTRTRTRLHAAVQASIAIGYVILVWFAFPIRGLPL
jgi:hypothetical protein